MAKILIVDDEENARVTLAEILRLEGHNIQTAYSGEVAVEALNRDTFDVMVLDLKMGGMSGMDVLSSVMGARPELSVIILTAYGTMDSAIQALRYQVHDYIVKPVNPPQIIRSIELALEKKRSLANVGDDPSTYRSRIEILPGGAVLAWEKRQISWGNGNLSLTPTEAKLLKILFDRRNEMVAHTELVFLIQGYRIDMEEAAKILRPVVSRLRHKLTGVPEWGDRIKNVRGSGYVLELN